MAERLHDECPDPIIATHSRNISYQQNKDTSSPQKKREFFIYLGKTDYLKPHGAGSIGKASKFGQNFLNHVAVHISQAEVAPGVVEGELLVVETQ